MLEHFFLSGSLCFALRMRVVERHVHPGVAHDRLNYGGFSCSSIKNVAGE
jgi:hypothetical protein